MLISGTDIPSPLSDGICEKVGVHHPGAVEGKVRIASKNVRRLSGKRVWIGDQYPLRAGGLARRIIVKILRVEILAWKPVGHFAGNQANVRAQIEMCRSGMLVDVMMAQFGVT